MDWSQMLIGHLQHHLRDPNRDHQHGRLYRLTYPSRPLLTPKKIDGEPIENLLALLRRARRQRPPPPRQDRAAQARHGQGDRRRSPEVG
jgi:hypothetical protein